MPMTAAVSATQGPVASDFIANRAILAAGPDLDPAHAAAKDVKAKDGAAKDGGKDGGKDATGKDPNGKEGGANPAVTVNPTFKYDSRAQRMVMVLRDQTTGAVVQQMPTEAALRQYEQAVKRVRDEMATSQTSPGQSQTSQTTSIEAAQLGVPVPLTAGTDAKPAAPEAETKPAAAPEAKSSRSAGSVTAGAAAAHYTIVV
jgi:hypothetical protein